MFYRFMALVLYPTSEMKQRRGQMPPRVRRRRWIVEGLLQRVKAIWGLCLQEQEVVMLLRF